MSSNYWVERGFTLLPCAFFRDSDYESSRHDDLVKKYTRPKHPGSDYGHFNNADDAGLPGGILIDKKRGRGPIKSPPERPMLYNDWFPPGFAAPAGKNVHLSDLTAMIVLSNDDCRRDRDWPSTFNGAQELHMDRVSCGVPAVAYGYDDRDQQIKLGYLVYAGCNIGLGCTGHEDFGLSPGSAYPLTDNTTRLKQSKSKRWSVLVSLNGRPALPKIPNFERVASDVHRQNAQVWNRYFDVTHAQVQHANRVGGVAVYVSYDLSPYEREWRRKSPGITTVRYTERQDPNGMKRAIVDVPFERDPRKRRMMEMQKGKQSLPAMSSSNQSQNAPASAPAQQPKPDPEPPAPIFPSEKPPHRARIMTKDGEVRDLEQKVWTVRGKLANANGRDAKGLKTFLADLEQRLSAAKSAQSYDTDETMPDAGPARKTWAAYLLELEGDGSEAGAEALRRDMAYLWPEMNAEDCNQALTWLQLMQDMRNGFCQDDLPDYERKFHDLVKRAVPPKLRTASNMRPWEATDLPHPFQPTIELILEKHLQPPAGGDAAVEARRKYRDVAVEVIDTARKLNYLNLSFD